MGDLVGARKPSAKAFVKAFVAALLFAALLFSGACSEGAGQSAGDPQDEQEPRGETMSPASGPETTAEDQPRITLGEEPGGRPEVVLRLEGGQETTFSGLCSVGAAQNVLGGQVPKRFTFDLRGRELSCRIQKRDESRGALKIVLIAGDTTRSVQQTNSPGGTINVTYQDG